MHAKISAAAAAFVILTFSASVVAAGDRPAPQRQELTRGAGKTSNSVGKIHGNVSVGGRIRQRVWVGQNMHNADRRGRSCNTVGSIGVPVNCR